jgi:hypothetical protein
MEQCISNGNAQDKAEPKPACLLASSLEEFFHFLNALSDLLGSRACIQQHSRIYSIQ